MRADMYGKSTAYRVMEEVRRDTGKSLEWWVRHYASQGYTRHHTASLLGYKTHSSFFRLCKRNGWDVLFAGGIPVRPDREYARIHNMGSPRAIIIEVNGVHACIAEHARQHGLRVGTVRDRLRRRPGDYAYAFFRGSHSVVNKPTTKFGVSRD